MSTIAAPDKAYHLELIDGRETPKPLPKKLHAIVQAYLQAALAAALPRPGFRILPELNVLCGEDYQDRIVPDITVVRRDARYIDGNLAGPAILCVEILSPGQVLSDLLDKAERISMAGTPLCWIVWPERCQFWVYSPDNLIEVRDVFSTYLASTKVEIDLRDLWADLNE